MRSDLHVLKDNSKSQRLLFSFVHILFLLTRESFLKDKGEILRSNSQEEKAQTSWISKNKISNFYKKCFVLLFVLIWGVGWLKVKRESVNKKGFKKLVVGTWKFTANLCYLRGVNNYRKRILGYYSHSGGKPTDNQGHIPFCFSNFYILISRFQIIQ